MRGAKYVCYHWPVSRSAVLEDYSIESHRTLLGREDADTTRCQYFLQGYIVRIGFRCSQVLEIRIVFFVVRGRWHVFKRKVEQVPRDDV